MIFSTFKKEIEALSPVLNKGKPHKLIALLAVLEGIDRDIYRENCFYYNDTFKELFTYFFNIYGRTCDKNRPLAPFYHLKSFSFWKLKVKEGKNIQQAGNVSSNKKLFEYVDYAYFDYQFYDFILKVSNRNSVKSKLLKILDSYSKIHGTLNDCENKKMDNKISIVDSYKIKDKDENFPCTEEYDENNNMLVLPNDDFIKYLNSLHNVTPANENALAEAQSQNVFFGSIHVSLELTNSIKNYLTSNGKKHVILTGHAGDGKSTIGLELYKQLINHPIELPLRVPMQPGEVVSFKDDLIIHLIKDMSEMSYEDRVQIINSACSNEKNDRYFIISNTGNLLSTLKEYVVKNKKTWLDFESKILSILQKAKPSIFEIDNTDFVIINLAQINNLSTISAFLDKLFNHSYWEKVNQCPYKDICPISLNVRAIKESYKTSKERVLSIYRFLHEYGHRLTLRQITAHIAYSITGSLNCHEIAEFSSLPSPPEKADFLFHNNFFGFKGAQSAAESHRLIPVQKINTFSMGSRPYPPLERMLWFDENAVMP
ncbi:MAG: hypothetical protein HQK65_17895, partial [Desulfamplus sp.]|nr:hypothetical protein [Desulfamplus sp.]